MTSPNTPAVCLMLTVNGQVTANGWHSHAYQQGASLHPPSMAVSWSSTYYLLLIY